MRFFCPFYWSVGILHILSGTIRGAGKTKETMFIFLISLCLFRILWIWGAMEVRHSLDLLMLVYPTSWFLGAVLSILYVWKGSWEPEGFGGK